MTRSGDSRVFSSSFIRRSGPGPDARLRRRRRAHGARQTAALRPVIEALELRTLLSTLPLPVISEHLDISGGAADVNENTPSIAYDPMNNLKLVTVFTRDAKVEGSYSLDGGLTWTGFAMPALLSGYEQATDASVDFDRSGNFYVAYAEHTADNNSGAIVVQKFKLDKVAAGTLTPDVADNVLYSWDGTDAAYSPILAVDNNLDSFTDPDPAPNPKKTVTDQYTGYVYVAWTLSNGTWSVIDLVASSDKGASFTAPRVISDGGMSTSARCTTPRMVVSQGTPDGRVPGGQLTVVWDDYSGRQDVIRAARILDGGGRQYTFSSTGTKSITDATSGAPGPDTRATTTSTINVAINPLDPKFTGLTNLEVVISMVHPDLSHVSVVLTAPQGLGSFNLLRNGIDESGNPTNRGGVTGADLGVLNGRDVGTIFTASASIPITSPTASAPFIGSFLQDRANTDPNLSVANGRTAAQLNGIWTLTITDFRADQNPPTQTLDKWSLRFSCAQPIGASSKVAVSNVTGAPTSPFPLAPVVSPDLGINAAPTIASDNSLGIYSPYQGRLYVAYVDRSTATGNPTDNTDIFLATSDDGGIGWTVRPLPVNDDNAAADGYSESFVLAAAPNAPPNNGATSAATATSGRPQFQPSIAVDPATGMLVITYLDTRHDAARARVATYLAASIDGGATFGPQTFVNVHNTAVDAITQKVVDLGPIPDNQSAGNANRRARLPPLVRKPQRRRRRPTGPGHPQRAGELPVGRARRQQHDGAGEPRRRYAESTGR